MNDELTLQRQNASHASVDDSGTISVRIATNVTGTSASPRMSAIETRVRFSWQNTFPEYYQSGDRCGRVSYHRFAPGRCANAPPLDGAPRVS